MLKPRHLQSGRMLNKAEQQSSGWQMTNPNDMESTQVERGESERTHIQRPRALGRSDSLESKIQESFPAKGPNKLRIHINLV